MDKDLELVKKAQGGDKEAVVTIVEKYRCVVTQKARPFYYIGGDQEDLIQEGMIALLGRSGITVRTGAQALKPLPACVWKTV